MSTCNCSLITEGIPKGCDNNAGGVVKIYITDFCNIDTITEDSPLGEITGITLESGASFYEFEFNRETSNFTENAVVNIQNGSLFYDQKITLKIPRREKSKRNTLATLMQKDLALIVLDSNGLYWLMGETDGVLVESLPSETGTAKGDFNGYTINLSGQESVQAREVDASIIAALIA